MPADKNRITFTKAERMYVPGAKIDPQNLETNQTGWVVHWLYINAQTQFHENIFVAIDKAPSADKAKEYAYGEAVARFDAIVDAHANIKRNMILPENPGFFQRLFKK